VHDLYSAKISEESGRIGVAEPTKM